MIGEEEDVVEMETVDDDTPQEDKRPPPVEEVKQNEK